MDTCEQYTWTLDDGMWGESQWWGTRFQIVQDEIIGDMT